MNVDIEKAYMIKIERDDDGKWSYDKTFDVYTTLKKEFAFNKIVEELRNIVNTIRGKSHYTEEIVKGINELLKRIDDDKNEYWSLYGDSYFDKSDFDITHSFDLGNASFSIGIVKCIITKDENGISFVESEHE